MTTNTNAALVEYANPLNWDVDENGIRRVWKEPGSETPEAYNGFELAKAALSTAAQTDPITDYYQGRNRGGWYNEKRIAWELERTAMGDGYYGNALRVAKDFKFLTPEDRSVLDRYATGKQQSADHVALQDIAMRVYWSNAEPVQQPDEATAAEQPDALYAELADKLQCGSVAFGSDGEWVSIRRYIRDEAVAALRAAHGLPLTEDQIDRAARVMSEAFDYPWEYMPEEGKTRVRADVMKVIEAAHGIKPAKEQAND